MKTTVIIPSRNERFLVPTVQDVLAQARGDLEVIVILEGYWPDPPLPEDPRLRIIHHGKAFGMRPSINAATRIATGDFFMKLDAHCKLPEAYDEVLKAECDQDWVVVPRRYGLDPEAWEINNAQTRKAPIDAHYLSYPFERKGDENCGLHGTVWTARAAARQDVLIDDEMSSQGSCWFMSRRQWETTVGEMDVAGYGTFIQEFQEVGMKTWLAGGRVVVNKKTWYAHLHKGKTYGRGYVWSGREHLRGRDFTTDFWMNDRPWPKRTRKMAWLVDHFWPIPGWPDNWQEHAAPFLTP